MHYNFDKIVDRADTNCVKYDLRKAVFGNPDVDRFFHFALSPVVCLLEASAPT